MKLSFKFKIALLSFSVSGALLTVFGMVFFAFVYQSGIDRMDRELRTLAESSLHGARPPEHWQNFDNSLRFIRGEDNAERIALLITGFGGRVEFKSENAPPELAELPRPKPTGALREKRPSPAEHFTERLDRNKDGRVSADEFDGPPHIFEQTDLNHDGFLTVQEAQNIEEPPQRRERPRGREPPQGRRPAPSEPKKINPPTFLTLGTSEGDWRVGMFQDPQLTITVAMDMDSFYADINRFRNAFMVAVPLGLLLLGITGWFLADRAMKPVAAIANTAEGITAKGLDRRIPNVGNDIELERLVTVSNGMLDRLEKSYHQAVRFSADAAHELQTPLTILQGELDNAIQNADNGSEEQQRYSMLLEELRNLKAVVQKLLLLAHADEGRLNINPQPVDLSDLIRNAAEDIEIMAPALNIECRIEEDVMVSADPALLNQTLRNMTSNAAKYATEKGQAVFLLEQDKQSIRFTLSNTSPPIPEEDCPLLFERFHRVEKSRTAAGSGLGLSLAREIARAHGGDLMLDDYANGMVSFTLSLPLS